MSLKAVKIKRSMADYKALTDMYNKSFPKAERFPIILLRIMSHLSGIHSVAFYDDSQLCGFSYFLTNEDTVFILFLAVNSEIRSKGYGSRILSWIKENHPNKVIFLDVEKLDENAENNVQRVKRVDFYKKNGIYQTNSFFTYDDVTYEILSTNTDFSREDYERNFKSYIKIFKKRKNRSEKRNNYDR